MKADGRTWSCTACDARADVLAPNLVRFSASGANRGGPPPCGRDVARRILDWTDETARCIELDLTGAVGGPRLNESASEEFKSLGLLDSAGDPTPDGAMLLYHFRELSWQKQYDVLEGQIDVDGLRPGAKVLDIGGGAGQTIRLLELESAAWKVVLDLGLIPLAVGARLSGRRDDRMDFCAASSHNLPFADGTFDLVIIRTSINYMHQRTAISEATRVLAPGGLFFCRAENIWWDLNVLPGQPTLKGTICRIRDLGIGSFLALTGRQPVPGSTLRGGRAYSTWRNIRRELSLSGCKVVRVIGSQQGPRFRGRPTQFLVTAIKN